MEDNTVICPFMSTRDIHVYCEPVTFNCALRLADDNCESICSVTAMALSNSRIELNGED
jgi:hypothetical protein